MPNAQVVCLCFMLVCYGVVTASTFEPLSFLMLAIVGVVSIFLARELRRRIAAHERARTGADRRWAVVASVSSAARDAEPRRVLEGVVEAIVALGYETAAIHLPGEAGQAPGRVARGRGGGSDTLDPDGTPDSIRSEVLGKGRDVIVRVKEVDRQAARGLRSSGIETVAGTPIVVGDRPGGVLLVASTIPTGSGLKRSRRSRCSRRPRPWLSATRGEPRSGARSRNASPTRVPFGRRCSRRCRRRSGSRSAR